MALAFVSAFGVSFLYTGYPRSCRICSAENVRVWRPDPLKHPEFSLAKARCKKCAQSFDPSTFNDD